MTDLVFTPLELFAAVDEPGAEPLATAAGGGTVIPAAGLVLVYGDGGAGKTTLTLDLAFALAAGDSWLELVTPERPLRIAIVENEGPRAEFRKKLERKLTHTGANLDGRISVLGEPWAGFTFADDEQRRALAAVLEQAGIDVLIVGPVASVGMEGGGTPDEITRFEQLLRATRDLVPREFAIVLVHHENRIGRVSGAWERVPDTLLHVTGQGHGRTRLYWQKVRWSSALHGTTTQLVWADGESFTVEAKPEISEDTMTTELLAAVRENPGGSWSKIREHVTGKAAEIARVRDRLLHDGAIVNAATREGYFQLWLPDDPATPADTRSRLGTAWERLPFLPPAGAGETSRSPVPYVSRNGVGNGTAPTEPEVDPDELDRLEQIAADLLAEEAERA